MSDTPTPPWGLRVGHDVRHEYANGIERLQTRLLHIGLFLLTVVALGGGAGVLMVVTESSRATTVSITVVAGCVVAVLVALAAAMSATRRLTPLLRRPQPVAAARPAPPAASVSQPVPVPRQQDAAPLWSERQVTLTDDPGQRREVFVKLARRLQSLINRAIKRIDELEQENEDPELLDGLYEIDHLFTLARRQGENLAVLGGEAPQRRSNKPVSVYAVLLASVSEAEHYRQIAIVPVEDVEIHGHAVAEIIHLLAELLENATRFSAPDGPKVEVRAHKVTAGLAIEVQDRGLGMSHEDLDRINSLLDGSTRIDLSDLLSDGRIGLAVVRELARRHNIRVRLQSNIFGGIAAAVVIPPQLLSQPEQEPRQHVAPQQSVPPALPKRRPDVAHEPSRPAMEPAQVPAPTPIPAATESAGRLAPAARPSPQPAPGATVLADPGPAAPIQVPAPMPIPAAAAPSTVAAPALPRRHRAETEDDLPALPVRAPGRSYDDLRTGGNGIVVEETPAPQGDEPPPLPQRRGSHLRQELLEPPSMTRPVPGHNTGLMKTFQEGRDNWVSQQDRDANKKQGDSWPTT
jgi:signal transduction histidine kinase